MLKRRLYPLVTCVLFGLGGCDKGVFADPEKKSKEEIAAEEKEKRQIDALLTAGSEADLERELSKLSHSGESSSLVIISKAMLAAPSPMRLPPASRAESRKHRMARELRRLLPMPDYQALLDRYLRALAEGEDAAQVAAERLERWLAKNREFLEWDPYLLRFELKPKRQPGTFGRST